MSLSKLSLNKISYFFVCPGARNQPFFQLGIDKKSYETQFDERSASFMALGMSKQSDRPVAVITTSGTAVGETLPAVMEAYHSNIKLIVISYDRPKRLKKVYSPQATHQERCLTPFIRSTKIDDELYPKHINLLTDFEQRSIDIPQGKQKFTVCLLNSKKIIDINMYQKIKKYYLIHQGINSFYFNQRDEREILTEDSLNSLFTNGRIKEVIRIGKVPDCSMWRKLEKTINKIPVYHLLDDDAYIGLTYGEIISLGHFRRKLYQDIKRNNSSGISYKELFSKTSLSRYPQSEISKLNQIIEENDSKDTIFYLGNSLTIRNIKYCKVKRAQLSSSRGLNGIDGQISTAIGIAKSTTKRVIAIIGDQTFFYDSNIIFQAIPKNLTIKVINNHGGKIFKKYGFSNKMVNEHNINISDKIKSHNQIHEVFVSHEESEKLWNLLKEQSIYD